MAKVTRTITTSNQWTDPVKLSGYFNISISGDWSGTITSQRSWDLGNTWLDVDTFTENTEEYGLEPEHTNTVYYRVGAADGDFSTGSASLRLSN